MRWWLFFVAVLPCASGFAALPARAVSRPTCSKPAVHVLASTAVAAAEADDDAAAALVEAVITKSDPAVEPTSSLRYNLVTAAYVGLWYFFNVINQIYNKRALNALPIPYTMAAFQLFVGIPYVAALWASGMRKAPKLSAENMKTLIPVSLGHLGTHLGAVVSLSAGAVSFTHIVKASEPVVSAALSAVLLGTVYSPAVYASLVPIVGGVALASLKELSFTWLGFIAAMGSNLSSALRAILAKRTMGRGVGENMGEVYAPRRQPLRPQPLLR